jgi:M-phase inducer tyrosine phosphatase
MISSATVARLLEGLHTDLYDNVVIVDCRFPYEYNGGHIRGGPLFNPLRMLLRHQFLS